MLWKEGVVFIVMGALAVLYSAAEHRRIGPLARFSSLPGGGGAAVLFPTISPSQGLSVWYEALNRQRPVNLDLRTIKLPVTAYTSILHRISGVILFFGIAVLLYALELSLSSEEGFAQVHACMSNPLVKLVVWGLLSALLYHLVAGIRHLVMDAGIGETLEGGKLGSKIVLVVSAVLILLAGVWIW